MTKADKMFEEINYAKYKNEYYHKGIYQEFDMKKSVHFIDNNKEKFITLTHEDENDFLFTLDIKLHLAINEKLKEFGWI